MEASIKAFNECILYFPAVVKSSLEKMDDSIKKRATEIRLRSNGFLSVTLPERQFFVTNTGELTSNALQAVCSDRGIETVMNNLCAYSLYSHQDSIKNGYITVKGGHRAGVCGTAVIDVGKIISVKNISSVCLRIAREYKGCAMDIYNKIYKDRGLSGMVIISPPAGGKTTILRDLARIVSDSGKRVSIIDERGELGAVYGGKACNDLGEFTDILDGYPKFEGIITAVRSLSPEILFCDEISDPREFAAVGEAMKNGVPTVTTAHAGCIKDFLCRENAREAVENHTIKYIICLEGRNNPGKIKDIYTAEEALAYA